MILFPVQIDGKPTIDPREKEVEVQIQLGEGRLKAKFKLSEMMVNNQLLI
jgi:hypothetical protein